MDLIRRMGAINRRGAGLVLSLLAAHVGSAQAQTLADIARTASAAQAPGGLFGSTELRSTSLKGLPQWTRVVQVMTAEKATFGRCIMDDSACVTPHLKNWRKIITEASKLNRRDKLTAVNDFFNRWPYKEDRELYGLNEYWATPREFMTRSGDCEDFAIAKYYALRELGFAEEDMRVVILMDEIRGIGHAVLAVYQDDDILILDSLSNLILPHERYKHYVPQYSMNETTRWAHIGGFEKRKTPAYQGLAARN